jgi:hypothetical protein
MQRMRPGADLKVARTHPGKPQVATAQYGVVSQSIALQQGNNQVSGSREELP